MIIKLKKMPFYYKLGKIPPKRHTQFRKPDGPLYSEPLFGTIGFDGMYTNSYHQQRPTQVKEILNNGIHYCPHFLGGGIGLIASAHLLAGSGGDGMLEVDYNVNPLREGLASPFPKIIDSKITLNSLPGLGITPDLSSLEKYLVYHAVLKN